MAEKKTRVMVIDDEKIVRDFFMRLLPLLGLEVVCVEDGYKALEAAKASKFDLYFIDVRMPGLNGLEVYRKLREIDKDALAVMITGYAVEDLLEQAGKEGVYSSIRKPFDLNQIKEIINKAASPGAEAALPAILIVDDDAAILSFFSSFLGGKNFSYKIAHSRTEAVALAKQEKFGLIFLDILLSDSGGVEACRELRGLLPQADIVLITAYPQKAKPVANEPGIIGCLYKPFGIDSIMEYIGSARPNNNR